MPGILNPAGKIWLDFIFFAIMEREQKNQKKHDMRRSIMFEKMRLQDQQLSEQETTALLESGEFGVLSTISANGYPYGVPLNYIYHNGKIYIHSAVEGHKISNIEKDSKVSFCVVSEAELLQEDVNTRFKSVIVFGIIKELTAEKDKEEIFNTMIRKLCPDYIPSGLEYVQENKSLARVFEIQIEHMTGKRGD